MAGGHGKFSKSPQEKDRLSFFFRGLQTVSVTMLGATLSEDDDALPGVRPAFWFPAIAVDGEPIR